MAQLRLELRDRLADAKGNLQACRTTLTTLRNYLVERDRLPRTARFIEGTVSDYYLGAYLTNVTDSATGRKTRRVALEKLRDSCGFCFDVAARDLGDCSIQMVGNNNEICILILILRPKLFIVWHGLVDLEQFLHTLKRIAGKVCAGGDSRNRQGWPDSKATLEDALCEMRDALEYAYDRWQPHEVGGLKGSLPAMDAAM